MKTRLNKIVDKIINLRDLANDEEFIDELENALIHLEAASDRLVAIDEDEGDDLTPVERVENEPLDMDEAQSFVDRVFPTLN